MFNRQWFPPGSQEGLTQESLLFEDALADRSYDRALHILSRACKGNASFWRRQYRRALALANRDYESERRLTVFWDGFWPDFDIYNNQFLHLLRASSPTYNIVSTTDPRLCDISFFSCYGTFKALEHTRHTTRILFLGENVRPSFSEFDYCLSSDLNDYSGRNTYLPLWMLHINLFGSGYPDRSPIDLARLTESRTVSLPENHKAVFIGNNQEPSRINLLNQLRMLGMYVDEFGSQTRPISDKQEIYAGYRYIISPENSYYPGYITEKLIDSFISGRYFFYWGGLNQMQISHPSSMIYLDLAATISNAKLTSLISPTTHTRTLKIDRLFERAYCESLLSRVYSGVARIVRLYY